MEEKLRRLMKHEGINSTRLAEILGIQASGISHIMSGRNKPSYDFLLKLLQRFPQISPDWLLLDRGPMYRDEIKKSAAGKTAATGTTATAPDSAIGALSSADRGLFAAADGNWIGRPAGGGNDDRVGDGQNSSTGGTASNASSGGGVSNAFGGGVSNAFGGAAVGSNDGDYPHGGDRVGKLDDYASGEGLGRNQNGGRGEDRGATGSVHRGATGGVHRGEHRGENRGENGAGDRNGHRDEAAGGPSSPSSQRNPSDQKRVERVVVFYRDKTFSEYRPE